MSVQAMGWVFSNSRSEGSERLVLLAIANHADSQGLVCWPRVELLAVEAGVSRRTVFRALESLVLLGELEITSGRGRGASNTYRLKGVTVTPQPQLEGCQIGTPGVTTVAQGCATGGTQNRKEPSENLMAASSEKGATVTPFPKDAAGVRTDTVYDPDTLEMDSKGRWFVR